MCDGRGAVSAARIGLSVAATGLCRLLSMGVRGKCAPRASREAPEAPNTAKHRYRSVVCRSRRSDEISGLAVFNVTPHRSTYHYRAGVARNLDSGEDSLLDPSRRPLIERTRRRGVGLASGGTGEAERWPT